MHGLIGLLSSLILALSVLSASAEDVWKVEHLSPPGGLYAGEELLATNGIETLTYFKAGDPEKPLVVFVPGGFHLARVYYGYPGGVEKVFLAYWL
ncbi:MAG: alpha/beta hydrolase, partial [Pseudomonadota bacterium]